MALQVTEYTFLEHFSSRYGIPAPRYLPASAGRQEIKRALDAWGSALVKPDVPAGGRGKSGSVVEVSTPSQALSELKRVSGTAIGGRPPRCAYLVEYVPARMEVYTALTYNTRFLGPSVTVSLRGGVDIEEVPDSEKATIPVDIYRGLDAYQAGELLAGLGCPRELISPLSRSMISFWDLFVSAGMLTAEINPWRITPRGNPCACDFKAVIDQANYKSRIPGMQIPEYPDSRTELEEEMAAWNASSHRGQAHLCDLGGAGILPVLFGGGASTIITETLQAAGGSPLVLTDFGGNPPYERMRGTARILFRHRLSQARLLLILGGKANNTLVDVTFQAVADALVAYVEEHGPLRIPVVIGRGGPRLVRGMLIMKRALEYLGLPHVIFGPDTPVTLVAEYAARLARAIGETGSGPPEREPESRPRSEPEPAPEEERHASTPAAGSAEKR